MAARSKHPGDIIMWIEKIIESCTLPMQEISARKVIELFDKRLERTDYPSNVRFHIIQTLRNKLDDKMYNRIQKNLENHANIS